MSEICSTSSMLKIPPFLFLTRKRAQKGTIIDERAASLDLFREAPACGQLREAAARLAGIIHHDPKIDYFCTETILYCLCTCKP